MVLSAALGAGISALGSIGSGVISGALSSASAKRAYNYSKLLQENQAYLNYKYGRKSTLQQYSWQRKGLEKAGYNPLLALGGAEGVANTGWTSAQSGPDPDYENAVTSALQFAQNTRENKLAGSQIDLNTANADTQKVNQGLIRSQIVGQDIDNSYSAKMKESQLALNNVEQYLKYQSAQEIIERTKWISPSAKAQIYNLMSTGKSSIMQANAALKNADTSALDSLRRYDIGTNTVTEGDSFNNSSNIGAFGVNYGGSTAGNKIRKYYKKNFKGSSAKQQTWHDNGYDILY